jgi:uncharacterized protein with GYD domain
MGRHGRRDLPLGGAQGLKLDRLLGYNQVDLSRGLDEEELMPTYIMLSTLTDEGAKTVKRKPQRIKEVNQELEKAGLKVHSQWAVLGPYDFVNVVEAADNTVVAKVSAELAARGSIKVMTLPAVDIDTFIASLG